MNDHLKSERIHIPLPKNTKAFYCGNCGALALDQHAICRAQGRETKADWCGIRDNIIPQFCHNRVHNVRFACDTCGKVSVNPELLCAPQPMEKSVEKVPEIKKTGFMTQFVLAAKKYLGLEDDRSG